LVTDTHLFLVDTVSLGLTGEQAEGALEAAGTCVNRNVIPYERRPPLVTSGILISTPEFTFRGFDLDETDELAGILVAVLEHPADEAVRSRAREQVRALCDRFPIYDLAKL
jgi:glycine hydroxymethyltransferase